VVTNVKFLSTKAQETFQIEVGVAFIGSRPPQGWDAAPATLYELTSQPVGAELWNVRELLSNRVKNEPARPETRHPIALEIDIQTFEKPGIKSVSEKTVTENLSRNGAAVFTTLDLAEGRYVRVISVQPALTLIAAVRLRRIGNDGRIRLHLEFIDGEWPFEGVEKPEH
jgi:hypothetical protein